MHLKAGVTAQQRGSLPWTWPIWVQSQHPHVVPEQARSDPWTWLGMAPKQTNQKEAFNRVIMCVIWHKAWKPRGTGDWWCHLGLMFAVILNCLMPLFQLWIKKTANMWLFSGRRLLWHVKDFYCFIFPVTHWDLSSVQWNQPWYWWIYSQWKSGRNIPRLYGNWEFSHVHSHSCKKCWFRNIKKWSIQRPALYTSMTRIWLLMGSRSRWNECWYDPQRMLWKEKALFCQWVVLRALWARRVWGD